MAKRMYISPHLDDAVFSCGGVIYHQTRGGDEVVVVTVCAGAPSKEDSSGYAEELHKRWGTAPSAVDMRKAEDRRACSMLGAQVHHLSIPDAIYRIGEEGVHYYESEEAIFGEIHPAETGLIDEIANILTGVCGSSPSIYAPIGYGGHVDHRLARKAVDRLDVDICFYRDYPYAIREGRVPSDLSIPEGEELWIHLNDDEISRWAEAVKEYRSQLSTFWSDPQMIEGELRESHDRFNGIPFIAMEGEKPRN